MIGSLAAIVAWALLAPFVNPICELSVDVIVPSVTVNASAVSESASSVAVIVIVCVAPAALLAANVTVPDVAPRSAPSAASVPSGAAHATCTSASTAAERVTVNSAFPPSLTFAVGPLIETSAESLSSVGVVVLLSSSVNVTVAELTVNPTASGVVPGITIVSSPSTTASSVGVSVSVPLPLVAFAGIVTLASVPAV